MEHVTCHESVAQDIEGVGLALVTFILSWRKCDKVCDWRSASHLIHAVDMSSRCQLVMPSYGSEPILLVNIAIVMYTIW